MKRLTERIIYCGKPAITMGGHVYCKGDYKYYPVSRLAEYEDADENDLVIRFPHIIGSKVYQIVFEDRKNFKLKIIECTIIRYVFEEYKKVFYTKRDDDGYEFQLPLNAFGKTVFSTFDGAKIKLDIMNQWDVANISELPTRENLGL